MEVESEIYQETNFHSKNIGNGNVISKFEYILPYGDIEDEIIDKTNNKIDCDGDLILKRTQKAAIEIEHKKATNLSLVGLQVWRGALLLADYIIHNRKDFEHKKVLEVGAGVGLTSICAAKYCKEVICTDIDIGNILHLIDTNIDRNMQHLNRRNIKVMELNFKAQWSPELMNEMKNVDVVLAADVIYDDELTMAFMETVENLIKVPSITAIYIAMEKRYVFTRAEMQPVAPMFEHFLFCMDDLMKKYADNPTFSIRPIQTDFPQFFDYERVKELVLFKVSKLETS